MKSYPLVFSFRNLIAGNGFVASVVLDGCVLLTEEDDGDVWMFGVQPGGIAGGEDNRRETAFRQFNENYQTVLFDIASEAESFDEFKASVEEFFATVNGPNAKEWERLRALVKNGDVCLPDLESVDANKRPPSVEVKLCDNSASRPTENRLPEYRKAA